MKRNHLFNPTAVAGICAAIVLLAPAAARAQDAADRLDMQAHQAYDQQNYQLAIKYWSELIKMEPDDSTAWYNRGNSYQQLQKPDEAIADYTQAIKVDPDDMESHRNRAQLFRNKWEAAVAKGDADDADADKMMEDYGEIIRIKPEASSYYTRAATYRNLHKPDKAIDDYTAVIKLDEKNPQGYQYRGSTYYSIGQWDKAIDDFNQLIQVAPNAGYGYVLRGQAYLDKGDADKAIADANDAIRIDPANADGYALLGNAHSVKGEYDKAIAAYNDLQSKYPAYAEGFNAEAWLYATAPDDKVRNGAKAMELAQKACEMTGWNNASFIDTLAAAEAESGKFDDALKHQKQALDVATKMKDDEWRLKDITSRIALYEKNQVYHAPEKK